MLTLAHCSLAPSCKPKREVMVVNHQAQLHKMKESFRKTKSKISEQDTLYGGSPAAICASRSGNFASIRPLNICQLSLCIYRGHQESINNPRSTSQTLAKGPSAEQNCSTKAAISSAVVSSVIHSSSTVTCSTPSSRPYQPNPTTPP